MGGIFHALKFFAAGAKRNFENEDPIPQARNLLTPRDRNILDSFAMHKARHQVENGEVGMHNATIIEFARQLLAVHGAKAAEEAAEHERICVKFGAERTAETWRSVQSALAVIKGRCLH